MYETNWQNRSSVAPTHWTSRVGLQTCALWHVAKSWWERFKDQSPAGRCNPAPKKPSLLEQSYPVHLKKCFQLSPPGDSSLRFLFPVFPPTPSYQFVTLFILAAINFQPASGFPLCCHFSAAPLCLPRASLLDQYRLIAVEYQDSWESTFPCSA